MFGIALAVVFVGLGIAAGGALGGDHGGGHTPVTICHKPGTPAEHTLVVDDDSVELTGHLGHGDTIGPCGGGETTPTDTTPTDTTPTTPTETTPTETTPTDTTPTTPTETQPPNVVTGTADVWCDLPSQTYHVTGTIDGNAADSATPATIPGSYHGWTNVTVHRGDTDFRTAVFTYGDCVAKPQGGGTVTTASTTSSSATAAVTASAVAKVAAAKKAAKAKAVKHAEQPKLTGNPKVDKCKQKENGLLVCQPGGPGTPTITVVPGQG